MPIKLPLNYELLNLQMVFSIRNTLKGARSYFSKFRFLFHLKNHHSEDVKDLSQFQRKSAHAPQKELPKRKL